jgi:tetratricopeptide (TPR) repeat protein
VGTTVNITDFLSVQAGGLVSGYNPRVSVGAALAVGTLDLTMNYNLDLSGTASPLDKFSVEARFVLGDSGRGDAAKKAEELYLQGIEEYAAGNYAGAIDLWQQVLALDPKYSPAEHYLSVARDSLALQQQASGTK